MITKNQLFKAVGLALCSLFFTNSSAFAGGAFGGITAFPVSGKLIYGPHTTNSYNDIPGNLGVPRNVRVIQEVEGYTDVTCVYVEGRSTGNVTLNVSATATTNSPKVPKKYLKGLSIGVDVRGSKPLTTKVSASTSPYANQFITAQGVFKTTGSSNNVALYDSFVVTARKGRQQLFTRLPSGSLDSQGNLTEGRYAGGVTCTRIKLDEAEEEQYNIDLNLFLEGILTVITFPARAIPQAPQTP